MVMYRSLYSGLWCESRAAGGGLDGPSAYFAGRGRLLGDIKAGSGGALARLGQVWRGERGSGSILR